MNVTHEIRKTTAAERATGAGNFFFGFKVSMTWEEFSIAIKRLFGTNS